MQTCLYGTLMQTLSLRHLTADSGHSKASHSPSDSSQPPSMQSTTPSQTCEGDTQMPEASGQENQPSWSGHGRRVEIVELALRGCVRTFVENDERTATTTNHFLTRW